MLGGGVTADVVGDEGNTLAYLMDYDEISHLHVKYQERDIIQRLVRQERVPAFDLFLNGQLFHRSLGGKVTQN